MPVSWTSKLAYQQDIERLTGLRADVYRCVRDWPVPSSRPSIEDIANHLDMRVATVCGRLGELKEAGLILEGDPKHSASTGKRVKTYVIAPYREKPPADVKAEQGDLFGELLNPEPRKGAVYH
jgi:hypothetical protein